MVIPSHFGGVCMSGDSTITGELCLLHYYMFLFKFKIIYSSASLWPWTWCTLQSVTSFLLTVKTQEGEGQVITSILKLDSWDVSGLPWLFLDTLNLSESAQTYFLLLEGEEPCVNMHALQGSHICFIQFWYMISGLDAYSLDYLLFRQSFAACCAPCFSQLSYWPFLQSSLLPSAC